MPAASDTFPSTQGGIGGPLAHAFAITKDDSNDLAFVTRGISFTADADIAVILQGDTVAVTLRLAGMVVHPLRVTRVLSTATTATGIVGYY